MQCRGIICVFYLSFSASDWGIARQWKPSRIKYNRITKPT